MWIWLAQQIDQLTGLPEFRVRVGNNEPSDGILYKTIDFIRSNNRLPDFWWSYITRWAKQDIVFRNSLIYYIGIKWASPTAEFMDSLPQPGTVEYEAAAEAVHHYSDLFALNEAGKLKVLEKVSPCEAALTEKQETSRRRRKR